MSTFKERLSELLRLRGITQRELAARVELTEATVSRYMSDERIPNATILARIATALNTSSDYLLGNDTQEDFNVEKMVTLLARNASNLTNEEKTALIAAIIGKK